MKKGIMWRLALIAATVVVAFIFFLPNTPLYKNMPAFWKKVMPEKGIVLGLDLQGGLHLVFEVDSVQAFKIATDRAASSLNSAFNKKGINNAVKRDGEFIVVTTTDPVAKKVVSDLYPQLQLDSESSGIMKYRFSEADSLKMRDNATDQVLEIIRNRIDQFGVAEPIIHRQGDNEIVVQLPGVKDPKRAVEIIGKTALLEFKIVDTESPVAAELPGRIALGDEDSIVEKFKSKVPAGSQILFQNNYDSKPGQQSARRVIDRTPILLKKDALLTGDTLTEAKVNIDKQFGEPTVSIRFDATGSRIFEDITGRNVGKRLAIILDGNVNSAPVIKDKISGGDAMISGGFSLDDAKDLAIILRAGSLPAPLKTLQNLTVGPSLGRDSIEAGKMAGMLATVLVIVFMVFYYRISGIIADMALVLNLILLLGAMAAINATLTMPGIAGIILAIGMAVDSNVLMFERMREEVRAGKTPKAAVEGGYHKAFWTIFDSHVTTLITAAVLFQFGTGPIKGFAVALSLGVSINLFTALIGTKTVFDIIHLKGEAKRLSI
jgi:preprotein translocase subunit SecD